ncbi:AraC-like DNA-binding protein [Saccharopolyspora lacisalsi]|uniref:AraC-like DNA-binding protein n=1 Tax=Halosaccharopolyspora lacisalsi TaxID=1000566 RepID=A0A839DPX4_9PSEU|nr:AraC family transcriptional regulator [Halosaccharopolyspora lacisalsi]MBA8824052.1 AraC-like DNA-binding protein [Halosaccharopolyspora lacisalsi]
MSEQHVEQLTHPRSLRFTTQGIAPASRVHLWERHNARALIPLDIRTIDESPLQAREINVHLPHLSLAQVNGSPQIVERSESFIGDNPRDAVAIYFATQGDAFFFHCGGNESLKPGQAIMYDTDLPFTRGFARGLEELVLTIPRAVYRDLTGEESLREPVVFPFGSDADTTAQALVKLLRSTVVPQANGSAPHTPDAERGLLDLLRPLVVHRQAGNGSCYVSAAKDYVERHLADPGLSAQQVAAAVGISPRHLARAFAETGLTLREYLRDRRLDRAWELLTAPGAEDLALGELAPRVGFSSHNYFSRAFRSRFDVTPCRARQQFGIASH